MMKKFILLVVIAFFWLSPANSQDCSNIDYKKNKDEFVKCLNKPQKKKSNFFKNIKNMFSKTEEVEMTSSSDLAVDWECLNLCKQAVKGTFTIGELNQFCISQCPIK